MAFRSIRAPISNDRIDGRTAESTPPACAVSGLTPSARTFSLALHSAIRRWIISGRDPASLDLGEEMSVTDLADARAFAQLI
jgi:hypothetical protein